MLSGPFRTFRRVGQSVGLGHENRVGNVHYFGLSCSIKSVWVIDKQIEQMYYTEGNRTPVLFPSLGEGPEHTKKPDRVQHLIRFGGEGWIR